MAAPVDATPKSAPPQEVPDFLSLVSHELAQPLTAARGSLELLSRDAATTQLDEDHRKLLMAVMNRNLAQLQALLDSIRSFSEVESGKISIDEVRPVPLSELFLDAVADFGEPLSGNTVSVLCDDDLIVAVDLTLFRQVLTNLIGNALKFGAPGSVIELSAVGHPDEIVLTVHNEGEGFPQKDARRIFDQSVRLQPGKRGLGLGLYVSKAIVDAHEGRIWCDSSPAGGTSFFVSIPTQSQPDDLLASFRGSKVLEGLGIEPRDVALDRDDEDLLLTLKIAHEVIASLRAAGVLDVFVQLPTLQQKNFLRWVASTDAGDVRRSRVETFISALGQSPLGKA